MALRFFEVYVLNPLEDYFVRKLIPTTTLAHCPHFCTACVYRPLPCTHTPHADSTYFPGRCTEVCVHGKVIGKLGVLHPNMSGIFRPILFLKWAFVNILECKLHNSNTV